VAINQPFTIWMLRSFFAGIPQELDEAAMVDGCTRLQAFRRVIIPVMWPGVVTTGLFSFLLAYNDFLLSSALTNAERMTMPAAIAGAITAESDALLMQGVAGAVSITIPLIVLVVLFQKQIVSGLTQGAVKG
jgi:ABC-type glycerol-3-phosphate transport system permease component